MRTLFFAAVLAILASGEARSQSDADADAQALKELNGFLNSPEARREYGATRPNAAQANTFLEKFPKWAQDELLAIVMDVMKESKAGAIKHADAYKSGGAQAAKSSFSPAVQQRIDALERRLAADPSFNSAGNLANMKTFIPAFLNAPGS